MVYGYLITITSSWQLSKSWDFQQKVWYTNDALYQHCKVKTENYLAC